MKPPAAPLGDSRRTPQVPEPVPQERIRAAAVLRNRAAALLKDGRPGEAQVLLEEAIRVLPGCAEAEIRSGNIRRAALDLDGAAARYRRALAIKPDYAWAHLELAICLQRAGNAEAAMDHYRQAVRYNPKLYKTVLFALVDQQNGCFWLDTAALKRELLGKRDLPGDTAPQHIKGRDAG
ncbi:MAG: tetratricopeptide repeat protein [Kiloniellaceae bacterium]